MQQPIPQPAEYPDDYEDDGEPMAASPRPSAEQQAELAALSVFPGGAEAQQGVAGDAASDQWWLQPDGEAPEAADERDEDEPDGDAPTENEPAPRPVLFEPPQPSAEQLAEAYGEAVVAPEPAVEDEIEYEIEYEDEVAAEAVEPPPAPQPIPQPAPARAPEAAAEPGPQPTARRSDDVDIPASVMSLPLLSGREQRAAGGASQRRQILEAAGVYVDDDDESDEAAASAEEAAAPEPRAKRAPAATAEQPRRGLGRRIGLPLLVIALAMAVLSGGAIATGQGGDVERVASSITPDVVEGWISDHVSGVGSASPAPDTEVPAVVTDGTTDSLLAGVIASGEGPGVPVRSTCIAEARTPRSIANGTRVTVIAQGVGDCSGWNVVRAGSAVSWVEASAIAALP